LVDALHDLHHRAGWPSLRTLAKAAGCSHTTISAVFSSPKLPAWGLLELLVEAMNGDTTEFHRLWLAAGSSDGQPPSAAPRIAGRGVELAAVRRHLETGTGLLLVRGEAGIGKTHLVATGARLVSDTTIVLRGSCLPLSTQAPLMPIGDVFQSAHDISDGAWLRKAMESAPPYVPAALAEVVPQLADLKGLGPRDGEEWARHRLFTAVGSALSALASLRPCAVLTEDLHWADAATLDLLEHLLTRPAPPAIVGTWRDEDPDVRASALEWLDRVRRLPSVKSVRLGPLTRQETVEQLAMLGRATAGSVVDLIHRRSAGVPLYVEQLAADDDPEDLPLLLAELLDRRVSRLEGPSDRVAGALAVADRALDAALLGQVAGVTVSDLTAGLHVLAERHLLASPPGKLVELRHPLIAEALRRRLVEPESVVLHARLAEALAGDSSGSPAEVSEHWRQAGDPQQELEWRLVAGRDAADRFAVAEAGHQWLRALELWPPDLEAAGDPPVRLHDARQAAIDALLFVDVGAARAVSTQALDAVRDRHDAEAAVTYERAARVRNWSGDPAGGLDLVAAALAIHEELGPSVAFVRTLMTRDRLLGSVGKYAEARRTAERALEMCARLEAPRLLREALLNCAGHDGGAGNLPRALDRIGEAAHLDLALPDPEGDISLALMHTHVLEMAGRVGAEVERAGAPGLAVATKWGLETLPVFALRYNMANALRLAGDVARAAELIDPVLPTGPPTKDDVPLHELRAVLDMLRGRLADAVERCAAVLDVPYPGVPDRIESIEAVAGVELWGGRTSEALARLMSLIEDAVTTDAAPDTGALFALAARAAADLADLEYMPDRSRKDSNQRITALLSSSAHDPWSGSGRPMRPAYAALWAAESARLVRTATVDHWVRAATHWDQLGRPHDAAYCRWRAAQVALATGQGSVAGRLLKRAARDAREHRPLASAIAETSRGG
jgi:hypothetical protein